MLNIQTLLDNQDRYKRQYKQATPFPHLVLENVCDAELLRKAIGEIPDPQLSLAKKSNDFIFAKNKFEQSNFEDISPTFKILRNELLSDKFSNFLSYITGDKVFIDPAFHGGGLHQGGKDSFLTMHADFDYHPNNLSWFRNLNILIYLNEDWRPEYGGSLKIRDGNDDHGSVHEVHPVFNRMVIMQTRENTVHGYDKIDFPDGCYRRSIAAYGYTLVDKPGVGRTTIWHDEQGSYFRKFIGKNMPLLVKVKKILFGSRTGKMDD